MSKLDKEINYIKESFVLKLDKEINYIKEWFDTAGLTIEDTVSQYKALLTEYHELATAESWLESLDAYSDILFIGAGLSHITKDEGYLKIVLSTVEDGVLYSQDEFYNYINAVIISNFSKFGKLEDIDDTIEYYKKHSIDLDVVNVNNNYVFKSKHEYSETDFGYIPKGKILKSTNYKSPLSIRKEIKDKNYEWWYDRYTYLGS